MTQDTTVTYGGTGKWKIDVVLPSLVPLGGFEGTEAGGELGRSLALADFNRDGKLDIVAGEPGTPGGSDGGSGRVIVSLHNSPASAIGTPSFATRFGESVATGDVDRDGYPDIVVGAPGGGTGGVYAFDGRSGRLLTTFVGVEPGDDGFRVAVGDIDGDGFADIVSSSPSALDGAGRITVRGNLTVGGATFSINGAPGEGLGRSLALADFDLDGKLDIAAGARGFLNSGGVVIVLDGGRVVERDLGNNVNWLFGASVAAGDLNGDGYPDVVVGAPGAFDGDGQVSAIDGKSIRSASGTPHTFLWDTRADPGSAGSFGSALAVGDLNGDGVPEVAAGAPSANKVVLLRSRDNFLQGAADVVQAIRGYGTSLAADDLDGDGIDDLAVGAPLTDVEGPLGTPLLEKAGAIRTRTALKSHFENGDIPTQGQFQAPIDSFVTLTAEPAPGTALLPGPSSVWALEDQLKSLGLLP